MDKKPPTWVTALKILAAVVVAITLVGLGLYYSAEFSTYDPDSHGGSKNDWGIAKDNPTDKNR